MKIPQIAFVEPEIAQNAGAMLRLSACSGSHINFVRPFSFVWCNKKMQRAGMDYIEDASYSIWDSFEQFKYSNANNRLIAFCTDASDTYYDFNFISTDIIMIGSESTGLKKEIVSRCDKKLLIPMYAKARSLNAAVSASIAIFEAIRQLRK